MRLLYAALDQTVPGSLGGSVHVQAVAEGLARLGHEVHVATQPGGAWPAPPQISSGANGTVVWHALGPPLGRAELRWMRASAVAGLARRAGAALIMERYYNFGGEGVLAARRLGVPAVLEVNAPIVDYPGSAKAALDRTLLVEPMRRWRDHVCRLTNLFVTPSAQILPNWIDRHRILEIEWGADVDRFRPDAAGTLGAPRDPQRVLCVFAGAFRAWHGAIRLAEALARLHRNGDARFGGLFIGDGPERAATEAAAHGVPGVTFTGALPHEAMPAQLAAADIGVAPFDPGKHGPLQQTFYWSPLKVFEYMASGLPVVAPSLPRLSDLVEHGREGWLYDQSEPLALDRALVALVDPATRRLLGAAARARVVRDFSWQAHCRALDARLRSFVSAPLRVLVVTDSFPPLCGGSGWSKWELVRGLAARGHHLEIVKIETGTPSAVLESTYESFHVTTFRQSAPRVPVLRNVIKNERLWGSLTSVLAARLAKTAFDIVHAQHVMSTVPAIRAGATAGVPVVATVRDYWPVCYWSDLIIDPSSPHLCPSCTVKHMTQCVLPRAGAASIAAWPVVPYMRANLRTKQRTLAKAAAIIAVSTTIARDLETRAPGLRGTPLFTIPNPVDMTALDHVHDSAPRPMHEPYVLYAGKLAPNKGVQFLVQAVADAEMSLPLVIAGDGPLRAQLEAEARTRHVDVRMLGWLDRQHLLPWMRHATMLAFPSYGPESLSRVLLEAAALGVPIAAMDTGGTRDIVHAGQTGLLSTDPAAFSRDLARLAGDDRLRAALGAAARADVHHRFSATSVVERVEHVYRGLLQPRAA